MTEPDGETTDPEEFAEEAGIDPAPQDVAAYEELAKRNPPWSAPG